MKKVFFTSALLSISMIAMLTSCQKETPVPHYSSDDYTLDSTDQNTGGWPGGMVNPHDIDSVK